MNGEAERKAELGKKYEIHTRIDVFLATSINSKQLSANDCPFIYLLSLLQRTEDGMADGRTSYYNKPNAKTKSTLSTQSIDDYDENHSILKITYSPWRCHGNNITTSNKFKYDVPMYLPPLLNNVSSEPSIRFYAAIAISISVFGVT